FVWLNMESDYNQWIKWVIGAGIEQKVIEFISTFPEYLNKVNDEDVRATPRSYERVSKTYKIYKEQGNIPRNIFLNVIKGNIGKVIAEEFVSFVEANHEPLISYNDVFSGGALSLEVIEKINNENHTRLYLSAMNILRDLEIKIKNEDFDRNYHMNRFITFLKAYPIDLMVGIMKDIKNSYNSVYEIAIENEDFVEAYFESYASIRG
ncbi:MAG: MoxR family ATPase, partial [Bacilli bacterium]|nr:MoxR family ATPase [Bacilli bacterium]